MYIYMYIGMYVCIYIEIHIYTSKYIYIPWHTHIYVCACICLHIEIWKHRCEHVQNNQLIHKHIHLTFYQSRHWMIDRHVYIIHLSLYMWICIWIYVPTCRNKCNWCTLKHLVLVRMNGLKSPKIPGNASSDTLLKSRFQNFAGDAAKKKNFAGFFKGGSHRKKWCAPSIIFFQERWFLGSKVLHMCFGNKWNLTSLVKFHSCHVPNLLSSACQVIIEDTSYIHPCAIPVSPLP